MTTIAVSSDEKSIIIGTENGNVIIINPINLNTMADTAFKESFKTNYPEDPNGRKLWDFGTARLTQKRVGIRALSPHPNLNVVAVRFGLDMPRFEGVSNFWFSGFWFRLNYVL